MWGIRRDLGEEYLDPDQYFIDPELAINDDEPCFSSQEKAPLNVKVKSRIVVNKPFFCAAAQNSTLGGFT